MDFIKEMVASANNKYAAIVDDGIESDVAGYIDTGSYIFNALLSGSIYGGIADNKIVGIAGEQATGKTFFALSMCKKFLDDRPDGVILYFDTEQAVTSQMFLERGMDPKRVAVMPVDTIESFRHQVIQIVDKYEELPKSEQKPMMIVLDSLGMLSTKKEMEDTAAGKDTKDMTRTQLIKGTFRRLTLKLGRAGIPMVITNHTYAVIGSMFPTKEIGGGSGLKYSASTIVMLSKKKVKEGTEVIGNIIHCKLYKSRLTKENAMVDVMLDYDTGLDQYYGLVDLALKYGIFKKASTRIELPDGTKVYEKSVYKDPEKYFTPETLEQLDEAAAKEYKYGSANRTQNEDDDEDSDETTTD